MYTAVSNEVVGKKGQKSQHQSSEEIWVSDDQCILISEIDKFIKHAMPLPYSDTFSGFPQILRSWNRDLRTTHNTFQSFSMHSRTPFFRQPLSKQLYMS